MPRKDPPLPSHYLPDDDFMDSPHERDSVSSDDCVMYDRPKDPITMVDLTLEDQDDSKVQSRSIKVVTIMMFISICCNYVML